MGRDRFDRVEDRLYVGDVAELGAACLEGDEGRRAGVTSDERPRLKELERENRELRRANEILKSASVFFATELDGRAGGERLHR